MVKCRAAALPRTVCSDTIHKARTIGKLTAMAGAASGKKRNNFQENDGKLMVPVYMVPFL